MALVQWCSGFVSSLTVFDLAASEERMEDALRSMTKVMEGLSRKLKDIKEKESASLRNAIKEAKKEP